MSIILNILNKKLKQAKSEYYKFSTNIFSGMNQANIKPNTNKKISIISYWLEVLEAIIPSGESQQGVDPSSIEYELNHNFTVPLLSNSPRVEYIYIRNKFKTLVPLGKVKLINEIITDTSVDYVDLQYISAGIDSTVAAQYNNMPNSNVSLKYNNSSKKFKLEFQNVGDLYNGQVLETSKDYINFDPIVVTGGISSNVLPFSQEQYKYYDNILNIIAIELKFNYSVTDIEVSDYSNTITGDNSDSIILESGQSLEL